MPTAYPQGRITGILHIIVWVCDTFLVVSPFAFYEASCAIRCVASASLWDGYITISNVDTYMLLWVVVCASSVLLDMFLRAKRVTPAPTETNDNTPNEKGVRYRGFTCILKLDPVSMIHDNFFPSIQELPITTTYKLVAAVVALVMFVLVHYSVFEGCPYSVAMAHGTMLASIEIVDYIRPHSEVAGI